MLYNIYFRVIFSRENFLNIKILCNFASANKIATCYYESYSTTLCPLGI